LFPHLLLLLPLLLPLFLLLFLLLLLLLLFLLLLLLLFLLFFSVSFLSYSSTICSLKPCFSLISEVTEGYKLLTHECC